MKRAPHSILLLALLIAPLARPHAAHAQTSNWSTGNPPSPDLHLSLTHETRRVRAVRNLLTYGAPIAIFGAATLGWGLGVQCYEPDETRGIMRPTRIVGAVQLGLGLALTFTGVGLRPRTTADERQARDTRTRRMRMGFGSVSGTFLGFGTTIVAVGSPLVGCVSS
jgi:hypothetical protein